MIAIVGGAAALLCGALSGCSLVLDSSSQQCKADSDCEHFANHPKCMNNVCVESGLGPPGCFFPTTQKPLSAQTDFLNQCTTSTHVDFDNCSRIKYCDDKQPLPGWTTAKTGTAPPPPAPTPPSNLCTDGAPMSGNPPTPNMIWLYGSADFGPLMRAAQPSLSAGSTPYRAVFQNASSCAGVTNVFAEAGDATKRPIKDPVDPSKGGWAFYYDDSGAQINCRIDPSGMSVGVPITIGISDLYSTTCNFTPDQTTVREYLGPVVPFVFATKSASSQNSISAEAAHLVFANGGTPPMSSGMNPATPWTDYTQYYIRNNTAGSTVLTALLIGIDKSMPFWGIDRASTDNLRDALLAATDPEGAIGILSIDFYDKNRGNLKALYLKSFLQSAGYLPDSTPTLFDKINVRDGHYPLWGYVHFVVPTDPASNFTDISAAAKAMVLRFSVDNLDQSLIDAIIKASEVPQCAMKVERTGEIGNFATRNRFSCGCYFDFRTTGKTTCQSCGSSADCPNQGSCNYGYCEAR